MSFGNLRSDSVRATGVSVMFVVAMLALTSVYGFGDSRGASCNTMPSGSWFHDEYCPSTNTIADVTADVTAGATADATREEAKPEFAKITLVAAAH